MYTAVKTVQKTPVTEDMLMLVCNDPLCDKNKLRNKIYSLQNTYNHDWVIEEENKTIKKYIVSTHFNF